MQKILHGLLLNILEICSSSSNSQVPISIAVLKLGTLKSIPEKGPLIILFLEIFAKQNLKKE